MSSPKRKRRFALLAIVLGTLLVLGSIEAGARIWLNVFATRQQFVRYASLRQLEASAHAEGVSVVRFLPHRYLGYSHNPRFETPAGNRYNEFGFRGESFPREKPPGEFRIVCIGGSTTHTTFVRDHRLTYPAVLQSELRSAGLDQVRVINAGVDGYGTTESLINFELRVLDIDPDLIIVYHGVNDVASRFTWPPEAYKGDESGYRVHSAGFDTPIPPLEHSAALRILLIMLERTRPHSALSGNFSRYAPTHYAHTDYLYQKALGVFPGGFFKQVPPVKMLRENPPVYFQRNLESLVAIARQHGVAVLLATFAVSTEAEDGVGFYGQEYRAAIAEQNSVLKEIGRELDVPVYDFAAEFPHDAALYRDPVHVNEDGARRKAELFAARLLSHELAEPVESEPQ